MLRKLGHASKEGVETLKGRMACTISTWGPYAVQNLCRQAGRQACMPRHERFPVTEVQKFSFHAGRLCCASWGM